MCVCLIGFRMKTVKQIREELSKFPDDAECEGYEGEDTGLSIIVEKNGKNEYHFISTKEKS